MKWCGLKVLLVLLAAAALAPMPAAAQDRAAVAGAYCLQGVMEVGSCLRLSRDGKFEYFLAYGAYDEKAEGTWTLTGGAVVLDTPPYDRRPSFAFKRIQASESDAFEVIVETKAGRRLAGIDVTITCDSKTARAGITQQVHVGLGCNQAPSAVGLGLRMYDVATQSIDIARHAGPDKAYVFEFDPGDLGRKAFKGQRLQVSADRLIMVVGSSSVREFVGRTFQYVRQR